LFFDPEDEGNMSLCVSQKIELFNAFSWLTYLLEDHGWRERKFWRIEAYDMYSNLKKI
jgi:hypothetical protein